MSCAPCGIHWEDDFISYTVSFYSNFRAFDGSTDSITLALWSNNATHATNCTPITVMGESINDCSIERGQSGGIFINKELYLYVNMEAADWVTGK